MYINLKNLNLPATIGNIKNPEHLIKIDFGNIDVASLKENIIREITKNINEDMLDKLKLIQ